MIQDIVKISRNVSLDIGKLNQYIVKLWAENIVFTWRWWIALCLLVVPWVIWFMLRPKKDCGRILLAGLISYVILSILDSVGAAFSLWTYPIIVFPYLHTFYLPWDLSLIPVSIMLLIQYKNNISVYLKALIFTLVISLIIKPLLVWLNIFALISWKYYYDLPAYFIIFLISYTVSKMRCINTSD
jgi:hypothetical protein